MLTMLSPTDRAMLTLATTYFRHPGTRERAIRDRFGLTSVQFWQAVNRLVDDPVAAVEAPMQVLRLRRQRDRVVRREAS